MAELPSRGPRLDSPAWRYYYPSPSLTSEGSSTRAPPPQTHMGEMEAGSSQRLRPATRRNSRSGSQPAYHTLDSSLPWMAGPSVPSIAPSYPPSYLPPSYGYHTSMAPPYLTNPSEGSTATPYISAPILCSPPQFYAPQAGPSRTLPSPPPSHFSIPRATSPPPQLYAPQVGPLRALPSPSPSRYSISRAGSPPPQSRQPQASSSRLPPSRTRPTTRAQRLQAVQSDISVQPTRSSSKRKIRDKDEDEVVEAESSSRGAARPRATKRANPPGEGFPCTVCNKAFPRAHERDRHFNTTRLHLADRQALGQKEERYECPICHKSFLRQSTRDRHVAKVNHETKTEKALKKAPGKRNGKGK